MKGGAMISRVEKFESGWFGVALELSSSDIERLIARLTELQKCSIGHFHIRTDAFSADIGIADIAISRCEDDSRVDMTVE